MPKTKEELEKLKEDYQKLTKQAQELSEEELENVTGGGCTTYGDGYDGVNRPIVTSGNKCGRYEKADGWKEVLGGYCEICKYYSYNHPTNPKRISLVSAWCLHPDRAQY